MATVAIAGSSGLIGSALVSALRAAEHRVLRIVRRTPANDTELRWDPEAGVIDVDAGPTWKPSTRSTTAPRLSAALL